MNKKLILAVVFAGLPFLARAADPDYTSIVSAVSFGTVATGILAIVAMKAVPMVVMWGSRKVLSAIGR